MPYSIATFTTMLAAFWASFKNERIGSMLFGGLHFFVFFLDAFSHVPGGRSVFKVHRSSCRPTRGVRPSRK